jgi:hypothetical protein
LEPPEDIVTWKHTAPVTGSTYLVQPRSIVVLMERTREP